MPLPAGKGPNFDLGPLMEVLRAHSAHARRSFNFAQSTMSMTTTAIVYALADSSPRIPPPLPRFPDRQPKLLLFIASHISSASRLAKVQRCLRSVVEQRGPGVSDVLISWSASSSTLRELARAQVFENELLLLCEPPLSFGVRAFERSSPLSQFEHFASLLPEARRVTGGDDGVAGSEAEAWVMFTDDDDLLHPERCAAYLDAIRSAPGHVQAVSAAWVARPVLAERDVESAADVDALLEACRVIKTPRETAEQEAGAIDQGGGGWDEYWNTALRLAALRGFFEGPLASAEARSCKYSDLALFYYVRHRVPTMRFAPHKGGFARRWCHYYDKPTNLVASDGDRSKDTESSGVTPLQRDHERVAALTDQLRDIADGCARQTQMSNGAAIGAALSALLRDEQAHHRAAARGEGNGVSPLVLIVAQLRSILELLCVNFVGAPHLPPTGTFDDLAAVLVVDQLISLGVEPNVAAVLQLLCTASMLREVGAMFALPIAAAPARSRYSMSN